MTSCKSALVIILLLASLVLVGTVGATTKIYPDSDGELRRQGVNQLYPDIHAGAGTSMALTNTYAVFGVTASTTSNQFSGLRVAAFTFNVSNSYPFNNSAIKNNITITNVTFSFYSDGNLNPMGTGTIGITNGSVANYNALSIGDFQTRGNHEVAPRITYANWSNTTASRNVFVFNPSDYSYINQTGNTVFLIRDGWDIDNNFNGTWISGADNRFTAWTVEYPTESYRPYLEIEWIDTTPKTWPKLLIDFDDGWASVREYGYPIMQPLGIVGTVYDTESAVTNPGYLDVANLTLLYNAGWDIGNHGYTHTDLMTVNATEQQNIIRQGQEQLQIWNFTRAMHMFAYPNGQYNATVISSLQAVGGLTGRTTNNGQYLTSPRTSLYDLPRGISHTNVSTVDATKTFILNASTNQTVGLSFHKLAPDYTSTYLGTWKVSDFNTLMTWINASGYQTITISEWYALNGVGPINAQFTPAGPLTTWSGIAFRDTSTGSPTAWDWNFGDGTTSNQQNPYKQWYVGRFSASTFNVSLNASTATGFSRNYTTVTVMRFI
jgi:peptidoglycan/xylan/chitin deacetylase (PgdA/CDA1 family)